MNKIIKSIHGARLRQEYDQPVYIAGYTYVPWKKWAVALLLILVLPCLVAGVLFHNKDAIPAMFSILFLLSFVALVWGLIAPAHFNDRMPVVDELGRKRIAVTFGLLCLLFFVMIGLTAPAQASTAVSEPTGARPTKSIPAVTTRIVTEAKPVAFETITQPDSSLPTGQTRISREGIDGIETYTYTVTLTNGVETGRTLSSQAVTTPAVPKVVAVGTYTPPPSTQGSGYTNSEGNHIESPSSDPAGASAQCSDGTYSYSASRRGTCSHHGGVARWL